MNYNLAITLKIINLLLFNTISLLFFSLESTVPTFQVFFLIALFSLITMLPWLALTKFKSLKIKSVTKYIYRALFNTGGMISWLEALKTISPNDATAIGYMTPIFTTLLAVLFCNERLSYRCTSAILVSMIGTFVIIAPNESALISHGALAALFAAFMWACYDVICKLQTTSEDKFTQTFYTFLFTAIFSFPIAISVWKPVDLATIDIIAIIGVLSVINVTILFTAYKNAPLTILMPFSFIRLIFMAIAMFIFFDEIISIKTLVGAILIFSSTSYIFLAQRSGKLVI